MAYNGWTNYETWNVSLWIDNDQGSYSYWQDRAETAVQDATNDASDDDSADAIRETAAQVLAGELESQHKDEMPELSGTYSDLLTMALGEVNWLEIAEHMVAEIAVEREENDEEAA